MRLRSSSCNPRSKPFRGIQQKTAVENKSSSCVHVERIARKTTHRTATSKLSSTAALPSRSKRTKASERSSSCKERDLPKTGNAAGGNGKANHQCITGVTQFQLTQHCRLKKLLGVGSYAKVYLIERQSKQQAVKIIDPTKASSDFLRHFLPRELEIIRRLRHSNIIRVLEILHTDSRYYIFMEYAANGDMLEFVKLNGAIMEPLGYLFFAQLHGAVQYLHGIGICHRDLKCENVLLDSDYNVKLCDFGFARRCVDATGKRQLSHTYCGSCAYAAPEVLQAKPYDPMVYDVWSLGCILFIVLCGYMPFDDRQSKAMLESQLKKAFAFPITILLSDEAISLLHSILEPDATTRSSLQQIADSAWCTAAGFVGTYATLAGVDKSYMLAKACAARAPCRSKQLTTDSKQTVDLNGNLHSKPSSRM